MLIASSMSVSSASCVNNNSLSGDIYTTSEAKQVQSVVYGAVVHVRPMQIQGGDGASMIGAISDAVFGGFLGNIVGGGTGRSLATAAGIVADDVAGQDVQGTMNKTRGMELEIRKNDGNTIMVVQKQGAAKFSADQRIVTASNGSQVTMSPR